MFFTNIRCLFSYGRTILPIALYFSALSRANFVLGILLGKAFRLLLGIKLGNRHLYKENFPNSWHETVLDTIKTGTQHKTTQTNDKHILMMTVTTNWRHFSTMLLKIILSSWFFNFLIQRYRHQHCCCCCCCC